MMIFACHVIHGQNKKILPLISAPSFHRVACIFISKMSAFSGNIQIILYSAQKTMKPLKKQKKPRKKKKTKKQKNKKTKRGKTRKGRKTKKEHYIELENDMFQWVYVCM